MAECKYRTDKDGKLCTYNAHPEIVQVLYDVKMLISELEGQYDGLDELVEEIEYGLFFQNGIGFFHLIQRARLRKAIDSLEDLKVKPWDNSKTINLKKKIKKLLHRVVS